MDRDSLGHHGGAMSGKLLTCRCKERTSYRWLVPKLKH